MAIACFGTFDVANYGDLIFPEIIKSKLSDLNTPLLFVSPIGGSPVVSDSVETVSFAEILKAHKEISGVIVGGGNIIDCSPALNPIYSESPEDSLLAYPSLWIGASLLAEAAETALCWNAPGVPGPLPNTENSLIRSALSSADYLSVRDSSSAAFLQSFEPSLDPRVVPDSAVGISAVWSKETLEKQWDDFLDRNSKFVPAGHELAVFHLKSRYIGADSSLDEVCACIRAACEKRKLVPIFLPIGPIHNDDFIARKASKLYKGPQIAVEQLPTLMETTAILAHAKVYCGSSLHGAIVHYAYGGKPVCVTSAEVHKFSEFFSSIGCEARRVDDWNHLETALAADCTPNSLESDLARLDEHWNQIRGILQRKADTSGKRVSPKRIVSKLKTACESLAPQFLIPQMTQSRRRAEESRLRRQVQGKASSSGAGDDNFLKATSTLREDLADLRARQDKTLRHTAEIKNDLSVFGSSIKSFSKQVKALNAAVGHLQDELDDTKQRADRGQLAATITLQELERLEKLVEVCRADLGRLHTIIFSRTFKSGRKAMAFVKNWISTGPSKEGPWVPERYDALETELSGCITELSSLQQHWFDASAEVSPGLAAGIRTTAQRLHALKSEIDNCLASVLRSASLKVGLMSVGTISALSQQPGSSRLKAAIENSPSPLPASLSLSAFSALGQIPGFSAAHIISNQGPLVSDPRGSIVICVHNAIDDVRSCLESVIRNTNLGLHRLIIVDDGSEQPTAELCRQIAVSCNATLIRNEEARGYTKAANQGITSGTGDFVVLLNSDVIVPAGWLERLSNCAFSERNVAVVGPLSNAASWQTIPQLHSNDGKWAVNDVPNGMSLEDFAAELSRYSQRLYPQVSLVNGFCYLITRQAIDKVGKLDEAAFPMGYGEEDDFSLRASKVGLVNLIADDCYVYHAKSKSFGSERRSALAKQGAAALNRKHPNGQVAEAVSAMQRNDRLTVARHFACIRTASKPDSIRRARRKLRIGWLKPHLGVVGGVRRTLEMSNRLVSMGHSVTIFTPDASRADWMPMWSDAAAFEELSSNDLDVVIVSDPDVIDPFLKSDAPVKLVYHLAAYMIYRDSSDKLKRYYERTKQLHHIANSTWTAEHVLAHCGVRCEAVFEGAINSSMFAPRREEKVYDVACYGSNRPHKGTADIEAASNGLRLLKISEQAPTQAELSHLISSATVFASACWHEGFSFCPLEAMACGVPVVMTDDGGSREYARHEENALVSAPNDPEALRSNIDRVLSDVELRARLIENGLETAKRFDWQKLAGRFAEYLESLAEPKQAQSTNHINGAAKTGAHP